VFKNLSSLFTGKGQSKVPAKNRLQMVLVQDRSGLTSTEMELFKKDLMDVISKYFTIENSGLDVEWKRTDIETALVINTPVVGKLRAVPKNAATS
jgi:cell division topological specificity factor